MIKPGGYGRIIQTLGVIGVITGIEIAIWLHASIWSILVALGSVLFAIGTKVIYFRSQK